MIFLRALRGVFHLLYHQFAWTYDWVASAVSGGNWVRWVQSMAVHVEGFERVLEVGHGPGHLIQVLNEAGHNVTAIDQSPQMGRRALRAIRSKGYAPTLVQADARLMPFRNAAFDAVIATFPAEYIAEPETWISFRRMLREDGRIVVLLGARPGGFHPLNLLSRLILSISGMFGQAEIRNARTRFAAYFDVIGLSWTYHAEMTKDGGEVYYVIAVPAAGALSG